MKIEFADVRKILIIKLRHIGDVLLTVPTTRAVRETFPEAYITALVNKDTEDMLTGNPLLNEVIVYDKGIKGVPLFKKVKSEIDFMRHLRSKGFDMTIDLTSGDRAAIYSYLSGARYRIAFDPEAKGFLGKSRLYTHPGKRLEGRDHVVLQNLHLVRQFGMNTGDLSVNIFFSEEEGQYVNEMLSESGVKPSDPIVHIHPTSRWLFKCWKDKSMAEIMDFCENNVGVKVVVTSGSDKSETDRIKDIMNYVRSSPIDMAGILTLKQLAALSHRAFLFFGVDSAPMHIAAAVGTPVIALFGPSGAFDWGPWNNSQIPEETPYPKRNGVQTFGIHTVIQKDWDCIPCGKDGCDGSKRSECLEVIEVEEVIEVIRGKVGKSVATGKRQI